MDTICRLCAKEKPLNQLGRCIDDRTLNLQQKLIDCCRWNSVGAIEYDTLPKRICNACYRKLEVSWTFAESVAQAQQELYSRFGEEKPIIAPIEHVNISVAVIKEEPFDELHEAPEDLVASHSHSPKTENTKLQPVLNFSFGDDHDDDDDDDNTLPLLENDLDFFNADNGGKLESSNQGNENDNNDSPSHSRKEKPKKRRYDAKNIDYDEIRRKRLQKLPGSLSRLCDLCGQVFSNTCTLQRHLAAMHFGKEKKLECKTCGKRFRDNYSLKTHENTHTGAKPWACTECDYRSACLQNLSKHLKQKHGMKRKAPVRRWVHVSELTNSNEPTNTTQNDA